MLSDRERYLTPEATMISEYHIKLKEQARVASVPTQRTVPVLLYPGESEDEDDSTFTRWAHGHVACPARMPLELVSSKADVRLERKLCYELAKLKAKALLRSLYRNQYAKPVAVPTTTGSTVQTVAGHSVLMSEPYTPTPVGGERVGMQADPQRDAQSVSGVRAILTKEYLKLP